MSSSGTVPDGEVSAAMLSLAIEAARRGAGHTRPNPPVGAVVWRDGKILGEGFHKRAGGDHAETAAIKDAASRGFADLSGATLYVTLEPCSKAGRVGPCTDAIAKSGISSVVYAVEDPNPANAGKAAAVLARAGVDCRKYEGDDAVLYAARRLVAPFAKHVKTSLPFVTVKIAMSLDGRICDADGNAKWISSDAMRGRTNALRNEVDAIMVGAETVRRDNPSLLARPVPNPDLVRAVVSRSGDVPCAAQVFSDGKNKTFLFSDAGEAVRELGRMGMMHVLCEGGMKLAVSLAKAGLVDEWIAVVAPKVIGDGPLPEAVRIERVECLPDL